jgi:hypothetical protein
VALLERQPMALPPMRLSSSSGSRDPLKDTGVQSQLNFCVISNADEYDCRILNANGGPAVTLITGGPGDEAHGVPDNRKVLDLYGDGPCIALQDVVDANQQKFRAQLWSFLPVAQLPIKDGTYKIVNNQTQLVLDLTGNNANGPGT